MLSCVGALLLFVGLCGGSSNNNLEQWYKNFTERVEDLLQSNDSGISFPCQEHLAHYVEGLQSGETWALKMFDSGGKLLLPGILNGNVVDLGSFDECLNTEHERNESKISGKYCIGQTYISVSSKEVQKRSVSNRTKFGVRAPVRRVSNIDNKIDMQLAKCFPAACSAADMKIVYEGNDLEITFTEDLCQTKADQPKLTGGGIATISAFGVILWIVILSTAYETVLCYLERKPAHSMLISFSALNNGRKLLKTSNNPSDISCLHGLRTISTVWIILDHRYSIQYSFPMKNSFYHFNWVHDEANMFMLSATLAVDTFLLLSGLLIVYNFMGAMTKGVKFNIILHYVHRYLRLTPVLAVMMVFHITLLRHVGSGPFWPSVIQQQLIEGCEIHWWKTLLYIQNIYGRGKAMCVSHSWYLSTDMQLFILSPFLILPLKRWPKLALSVIGSLAVLSMIVCFFIGWFFELNAYMQGNQNFDKQMDFVWYYYFPFHTRAAPWLIGMILGYLIFNTKEGRLKFPKKRTLILILWATFLAILCTCVFAGHNLIAGDYNRLANSIHMALVRPVWAFAIAGIIFICVNGYGGPVNTFLSLPVFQVFSKLTYTLYLVHYTLIYIITAQMRTTSIFNNFHAMYKFWGDFAFTCVVSVVLVLAVEFPVINIDRLLFGQGKKRQN